jgi:hypothetical protein
LDYSSLLVLGVGYVLAYCLGYYMGYVQVSRAYDSLVSALILEVARLGKREPSKVSVSDLYPDRKDG